MLGSVLREHAREIIRAGIEGLLDRMLSTEMLSTEILAKTEELKTVSQGLQRISELTKEDTNASTTHFDNAAGGRSVRRDIVRSPLSNCQEGLFLCRGRVV